MDCRLCNCRIDCPITSETKTSERFINGDCWAEERPVLWPIESEDVQIEVRQIDPVTIKFVSISTIERLCRLPYLGYSDGCPNVGKCVIRDRSDIVTKYYSFILVLARYNLEFHKSSMRLKHPNWSDRQLGNSRLYQGHVRKFLRKSMIANSRQGDELFANGGGFDIRDKHVPSMECGCMHVFATLARNRIKFEPKPKRLVTLVGLICKPQHYNDLSKWVKPK